MYAVPDRALRCADGIQPRNDRRVHAADTHDQGHRRREIRTPGFGRVAPVAMRALPRGDGAPGGPGPSDQRRCGVHRARPDPRGTSRALYGRLYNVGNIFHAALAFLLALSGGPTIHCGFTSFSLGIYESTIAGISPGSPPFERSGRCSRPHPGQGARRRGRRQNLARRSRAPDDPHPADHLLHRQGPGDRSRLVERRPLFLRTGRSPGAPCRACRGAGHGDDAAAKSDPEPPTARPTVRERPVSTARRMINAG